MMPQVPFMNGASPAGATDTAERPVRLGGEEFAVPLPGIDEASAAARADAFRVALEWEPLSAGAIEIASTVSAGVGRRQGATASAAVECRSGHGRDRSRE
jgi:GGDEF domain-containing protein